MSIYLSKSRSNTMQALRAKLVEKDAIIKAARDEVLAKEELIATRNGQIETRDATIERQKFHLKFVPGYVKEAKECEDKINQQFHEIEDLQQVVVVKDQVIIEKQAKINALKNDIIDLPSWAEVMKYKEAVKEQVKWKCDAQRNFTDKVTQYKALEQTIQSHVKKAEELKKENRVAWEEVKFYKNLFKAQNVSKDKIIDRLTEEKGEVMDKYKLTQERLASVCKSKDNWKITAKKCVVDVNNAQELCNYEVGKKRKAESYACELVEEARQLGKEVFLETYKKERNAKNLSAVLAMSPTKFKALHARINAMEDEGVAIIHE